MGYLVKIKPDNHLLYVDEGETVLDAALKQEYDFPYNCHTGNCGTCKGKLLSGEVDYQGIEPEALTEEERQEGYCLFCSAIPKSHLTIEVDDVKCPGQQVAQQLQYTVAAINPLSDTVYQVLLTPPADAAIVHQAGQYVLVGYENQDLRPFSIANAPLENHQIELHIRHSSDNPFSTALIQAMQQGQTITLKGAYGRCIYHYLPDYPIIFMAGGTGFSQAKALIEYISSFALDTPMHLFWVARTAADLYLANLAEQWQKQFANFCFTPILSQTDEGWAGCTERIEKAVLAAFPDLAQHVVYASGPSDMVFTALRDFQQHGLSSDLLFSDALESTKETV